MVLGDSADRPPLGGRLLRLAWAGGRGCPAPPRATPRTRQSCQAASLAPCWLPRGRSCRRPGASVWLLETALALAIRQPVPLTQGGGIRFQTPAANSSRRFKPLRFPQRRSFPRQRRFPQKSFLRQRFPRQRFPRRRFPRRRYRLRNRCRLQPRWPW